MSYLDVVRLHFAGSFQADPSTVNNDATHYNNATFQPNYQEPGQGTTNGWWNPDGSGSWRLVDCKVTRVCYADGTSTTDSAADAVVGMTIADTNLRVAGKLVDLDPQQQMVSEVWGLLVRLTTGTTNFFSAPFAVAAFSDLWRRARAGGGGRMPLSAFYQSVLAPVTWGDTGGSRFLRELRDAAKDDVLSIKFNVDGYTVSSSQPQFTLGRIVGTIGPAAKDEPRHFVLGRQLGALPSPTDFLMPCVVHAKRNSILADFGNALRTDTPGGKTSNVGDITLGYLDANGAFQAIHAIDYQQNGWYESTAGVVQIDLTDAQRTAIANARLAVQINGNVAMQENLDGLHVRADTFVYRLSPGETAPVELYATQYGELLDGAEIVAFADASQLGPSPPDFATPEDKIAFDDTLTAKKGRATLNIKASDPGNPRGYIDGQVYGVRYLPRTIAEALQANNPAAFMNSSDFVSLLVWDAYTVPQQPAWHDDMQPIFQQYANLYPLMDTIIQLGDFNDVAKNAGLLTFAFSLPAEDPNHMPVTRDLSPAKRAAILKFLQHPILGTPNEMPEAAEAAEVRAEAPGIGRGLERNDDLHAIKSGRRRED